VADIGTYQKLSKVAIWLGHIWGNERMFLETPTKGNFKIDCVDYYGGTMLYTSEPQTSELSLNMMLLVYTFPYYNP
jgi:hypothetical protein